LGLAAGVGLGPPAPAAMLPEAAPAVPEMGGAEVSPRSMRSPGSAMVPELLRREGCWEMSKRSTS